MGLLSTEDSRIDLWEILENSGILEEEEALVNLKWDFLIDASVEDFQNVLEEFAVGCNVLVLDYLRPDIWSNHKGDLNLTMNTLLKVEREFLEKHDSSITIIQTIQANASLYEADFDKKAAENASQLYTKIDGGYTTYKRSHGLAFIRSKSLGMGNYEYSLFVGKVKGQAYQYMKETNIIYEINGEFDITYNKKAKPLIKQQQSLFNKGDK